MSVRLLLSFIPHRRSPYPKSDPLIQVSVLLRWLGMRVEIKVELRWTIIPLHLDREKGSKMYKYLFLLESGNPQQPHQVQSSTVSIQTQTTWRLLFLCDTLFFLLLLFPVLDPVTSCFASAPVYIISFVISHMFACFILTALKLQTSNLKSLSSSPRGILNVMV